MAIKQCRVARAVGFLVAVSVFPSTLYACASVPNSNSGMAELSAPYRTDGRRERFTFSTATLENIVWNENSASRRNHRTKLSDEFIKLLANLRGDLISLDLQEVYFDYPMKGDCSFYRADDMDMKKEILQIARPSDLTNRLTCQMAKDVLVGALLEFESTCPSDLRAEVPEIKLQITKEPTQNKLVADLGLGATWQDYNTGNALGDVLSKIYSKGSELYFSDDPARQKELSAELAAKVAEASGWKNVGFEVVNLSENASGANVLLTRQQDPDMNYRASSDLLNTAFDEDANFAVYSPSANQVVGAIFPLLPTDGTADRQRQRAYMMTWDTDTTKPDELVKEFSMARTVEDSGLENFQEVIALGNKPILTSVPQSPLQRFLNNHPEYLDSVPVEFRAYLLRSGATR